MASEIGSFSSESFNVRAPAKSLPNELTYTQCAHCSLLLIYSYIVAGIHLKSATLFFSFLLGEGIHEILLYPVTLKIAGYIILMFRLVQPPSPAATHTVNTTAAVVTTNPSGCMYE